MKSLPVAVKVGSAGVLGGGGIAGTGLLIHNKLQKTSKESEIQNSSLTELDESLIEESTATIDLVPNTTSLVVNETNKNKVSITFTASSTDANSKFKLDSNTKWTCEIVGIARSTEGTTPDLSQTSIFDNSNQKQELEKKIKASGNKKGFVTSCANNRDESKKNETNPLTSKLIVELKKPTPTSDNSKYEFVGEVLTQIIEGTYTNPKDLQ